MDDKKAHGRTPVSSRDDLTVQCRFTAPKSYKVRMTKLAEEMGINTSELFREMYRKYMDQSHESKRSTPA